MVRTSRAGRAAVATLALATLAALGFTAASAASRQPIRYDALGDSYASGYGVLPYDGTCGRSQSAYAVQLDGRMRIDLDEFVACAGATTATLATGGQLNALDDHTDLVTVSIGGNDIGWSGAVGTCLMGTDTQCSGTRAAVLTKVTTLLPPRLDSLFEDIGDEAPGAQVFVTGYPRLFSPDHGAYLFASPAEQTALNEGADLLNSVIAHAAADHGFHFVDVTDRFVDHGVNAPEPWVLGWSDPGRFHPNTHGYQAYTAAVTAAIRPSQLR